MNVSVFCCFVVFYDTLRPSSEGKIQSPNLKLLIGKCSLVMSKHLCASHVLNIRMECHNLLIYCPTLL